MRRCIKCNAELDDNAKFCPLCGSSQEAKVIKAKGLKFKATSAEDDEFFSSNAREAQKPQEDDNKKETDKPVSKDLTRLPEPQGEPEGMVKKRDIKAVSFDELDDDIQTHDDSIIWYEYIDESILIDDPFASHIDYEAEERAAMQNKKVIEANRVLEEICYDEHMRETLNAVTSPHVTGFRCIITGNDGSNKEFSIQKIADILKMVGKIDDSDIVRVPFGNMPSDWDVHKLYMVTDLNTAIERLFNLEDVSDESNSLQQEYVQYMNRLLNAPRSAYIILNAYPTQIQGFLSLDARIRYVFSNRVDYPDLTNDEIYEIFYNELPEFHRRQLPDAFRFEFNEYLNRNKRFFPFKNKELGQYLAQASSKQAKFQLPRDKYNPSSIEESFQSIVGMQNVKDQVYELQQYLSARKELEEAGAKLPAFHMHMMFLGMPGVGKTTIARIIAKILFELGYIREEKLIEVTSKDLIGNGNQTGIKTNKAILSALGGVLFIDEAYSLAKSCGQAGEECIATLIKAMEDYKNDLVCMFAGYTLEMNDFVKANSGMQSRIAYTFTFSDYSVEELYQILELKVKAAGMQISKKAKPSIIKILEWGHGRKNFGNGRFVDKLFQNMLTKHATLGLPKKELLIFRTESIPTIEEIMQKFGRFMG